MECFDYFGRNATYYRVGRDIVCDNTISSHDGAFADMHIGHNHGTFAYPDIIFDNHSPFAV